MTRFTVRTNRGWGWSVPQAPECPAFGTQTEASRYAELRNNGIPHLQAWDRVNNERLTGMFGYDQVNPSADPE